MNDTERNILLANLREMERNVDMLAEETATARRYVEHSPNPVLLNAVSALRDHVREARRALGILRQGVTGDAASCPRLGAPCPHPDRCSPRCVHALHREVT